MLETIKWPYSRSKKKRTQNKNNNETKGWPYEYKLFHMYIRVLVELVTIIITALRVQLVTALN